jgi:GxxExxY protein
MTKKYLLDLTYKINGAAIEVHKYLGPGLLESVYHQCLAFELDIRNMKYASELTVPFKYKGNDLDVRFRCDFLVNDAIVVELKAVEYILPVHEAQLLTYMNLLQVPKGILINFNVDNLYKYGIKTYVNNLYKDLEE